MLSEVSISGVQSLLPLKDGSESAPFLKELHAYVCIDCSDKAKPTS